MDNEQQIIEDILDSIYGQKVVLKDSENESFILNDKMRDEKRKELLMQIDSVCKAIARELSSIPGIRLVDIPKDIRPSVLVAIKAEVENNNLIIDANGKINKGIFVEIVNQSKEEILEKMEDEIESLDYISQEYANESSYKEDVDIDGFFEEMDDIGVNLSDDEKDAIKKAIAMANEILNKINEKVNSGMTEEEAWEEIFSGMSADEIAKLEMQFALADIAKEFGRKRDKKGTPETAESKAVEETKGKTDEEASKAKTNQRMENPKGKVGYLNGYQRTHDALLARIGNTTHDNRIEVGSDVILYDGLMEKLAQNSRVCNYINTNDLVHSVESLALFKKANDMQQQGGPGVTTSDYKATDTSAEIYVQRTQSVPLKRSKKEMDILGISSDYRAVQFGENVGSTIFRGYPNHAMLEDVQETVAVRVAERQMDEYYIKNGVDMAVAPIDFSAHIAEEPEQQTKETVPPISGAVEMIVDETATIQETQSVAPVTWAIADIKSRIAAEGRTRDILAANDNLQGSVKMEIPTDERNTPQGGSTVDDTEVGGEELE